MMSTQHLTWPTPLCIEYPSIPLWNTCSCPMEVAPETHPAECLGTLGGAHLIHEVPV